MNSFGGFSFPKSARLRRRHQFHKVKKWGQRRVGALLILEALTSTEGEGRIGLTVTRRFGKAHERNRVKRALREFYRLHRAQYTKLDIHLIPRKRALGASYAQLSEEFTSLLNEVV